MLCTPSQPSNLGTLRVALPYRALEPCLNRAVLPRSRNGRICRKDRHQLGALLAPSQISFLHLHPSCIHELLRRAAIALRCEQAKKSSRSLGSKEKYLYGDSMLFFGSSKELCYLQFRYQRLARHLVRAMPQVAGLVEY